MATFRIFWGNRVSAAVTPTPEPRVEVQAGGVGAFRRRRPEYRRYDVELKRKHLHELEQLKRELLERAASQEAPAIADAMAQRIDNVLGSLMAYEPFSVQAIAADLARAIKEINEQIEQDEEETLLMFVS